MDRNSGRDTHAPQRCWLWYQRQWPRVIWAAWRMLIGKTGTTYRGFPTSTKVLTCSSPYWKFDFFFFYTSWLNTVCFWFCNCFQIFFINVIVCEMDFSPSEIFINFNVWIFTVILQQKNIWLEDLYYIIRGVVAVAARKVQRIHVIYHLRFLHHWLIDNHFSS